MWTEFRGRACHWHMHSFLVEPFMLVELAGSKDSYRERGLAKLNFQHFLHMLSTSAVWCSIIEHMTTCQSFPIPYERFEVLSSVFMRSPMILFASKWQDVNLSSQGFYQPVWVGCSTATSRLGCRFEGELAGPGTFRNTDQGRFWHLRVNEIDLALTCIWHLHIHTYYIGMRFLLLSALAPPFSQICCWFPFFLSTNKTILQLQPPQLPTNQPSQTFNDFALRTMAANGRRKPWAVPICSCASWKP